MNILPATAAAQRLHRIEATRQAVMIDRLAPALADNLPAPAPYPAAGIDDWITRSWRRCLVRGQKPGDAVGFDAVSAEAMRRVSDESHPLITAARPVLAQLAHAMAHTRYFAILTNAQGIVVDVDGPIDPRDRRVQVITRQGVDLSERAVGTTAISAALAELHPVALHRGEHFYQDTSVYSCAGAPVFGPQGDCLGMLDLTGVEVQERPELKHLVTQCALRIENTLLQQTSNALVVRLRWPRVGLVDLGLVSADGERFTPSEADGLVCLNAEGFVTGSNSIARQMLPSLTRPFQAASAPHCSDLFALPWEHLFDAAALSLTEDQSTGHAALEVPLWSGMCVQALTHAPVEWAYGARGNSQGKPSNRGALRDVEHAMIRKAVDQSKGNVAEAARALGISRATVYRKLNQKPRKV